MYIQKFQESNNLIGRCQLRILCSDTADRLRNVFIELCVPGAFRVCAVHVWHAAVSKLSHSIQPLNLMSCMTVTLQLPDEYYMSSFCMGDALKNLCMYI